MTIRRVEFANPYHDERGRFTRKDGAAGSGYTDDTGLDLLTAGRLDRLSDHYGMTFSDVAARSPEVQWAKNWDGWATVRAVDMPRDTPFVATEKLLVGDAIDRHWGVPVDESYAVQAITDRAGRVVVVDGHHRLAALAGAASIPVRLLSHEDVQRLRQTKAATAARRVQFTNSDLAAVALPRVEFANPYHDQRGRFAPKNGGRAVPTKGVDGIDMVRPSAAAVAAAATANLNKRLAEDPLSTTDPDKRYQQLTELLSPALCKNLDTATIHTDADGDWTAERIEFHEALYQDFVAAVEAAGIHRDRQALVLGGLPGSGKSSSLAPDGPAAGLGVVAYEFGKDVPQGATHVSLNSDTIKEMILDADGGPPGIDGQLKKMERVAFVHEESSFLVKEWTRRLAASGYNVVLDNTMASKPYRQMAALAKHGYEFKGLFVDIDIEESLTSAKRRFERSFASPAGGRFVPPSVQQDLHSETRASVNADNFFQLETVEGWFRESMVIDNRGVADGAPRQRVVSTTLSHADHPTQDAYEAYLARSTT